MKQGAGWIAAVLALVALVGSGMWLNADGGEEAQPGGGHGFVVPVTLTTLERGDLAPSSLLTGTVRAARRSELGFDTGGIVVELGAREGDVVAGGALLARLGAGDEEHTLATAEASLELASRQLDLLLAGRRVEEQRRLEAVLDAARAEAELARLEVERGKKLLADRILSQSEFDTRIAAFDAANERRVAAEEEHAEALAGARAEDLAIARAKVKEEEARVAAAEYAISKSQLEAPWPGSVIQRFVSVGDHVGVGDPVFELVDLQHLELHFEIPGRLAPRVGPDARVRITLSAGGAEGSDWVLEKPLDTTIPAADEVARSFRGITRLDAADDPEHHLRPGMFVEAELLLEPVRDALLLDADAVLANERGRYVVRAAFPMDDGQAAMRSDGGEGGPPAGPVAELVPVRVLATADGRAAIVQVADGGGDLAPLAVGDRIALVGGDNTFPSAPLLVREPETQRAGVGH